MRKTLKKYFIPHAENNYHPHILHAKRTVFYGALAVACKIIVVAFVLFIPAEVYVMPDVLAEQAREIARLTNVERRKKDLPPFIGSVHLEVSASLKAGDMASRQYFSHNGAGGRDLAYWLGQAGYRYRLAGENLAVGFADAASIVGAWKKSPVHYANLVDADFIDLGVGLSGGVYNNQPVVFVAEHFGAPVVMPAVAGIKNAVVPIASAVSSAPPVVSVSPADSSFDAYRLAKSLLAKQSNLFDVSRYIYLALIVFFSAVLLINILVEIRVQHYQVIAQTLALIMLAIVFYKI